MTASPPPSSRTDRKKERAQASPPSSSPSLTSGEATATGATAAPFSLLLVLAVMMMMMMMPASVEGFATVNNHNRAGHGQQQKIVVATRKTNYIQNFVARSSSRRRTLQLDPLAFGPSRSSASRPSSRPMETQRNEPAARVGGGSLFGRRVRRGPRLASFRLLMYNLPPSSGGPGGNNNGIGPVVTSILTLVGVTAFLLSPVGSFLLSAFSSLLLLSIFVPLAAVAAFQLYVALNTVQGPCPNCGAPAQAAKRDSSDRSSLIADKPSLCLNCGAFVQASGDNKGIELVPQSGGGFTDGPASGDSIDDLFGGLFGGIGGSTAPPGRRTQQQQRGGDGGSNAPPRRKERTTIIDVEIEED